MVRTALVSGASRGIGEAIALRLAKDGWQIGLMARNQADLTRVREQIEQAGGKAADICIDLSDGQGMRERLDELRTRLGPIELLVCNAGTGKFISALDANADDWDTQMNLNARASFVLSQLVGAEMKERRQGHLVFITSDAAKRTFSNGSLYCASKYAQYAFASALRQELRPYGVKVSVLLPGLVASYFNDSSPQSAEKADWLQPSDVADAVAYAVSAPANVSIDEIMLHPMSQEW